MNVRPCQIAILSCIALLIVGCATPTGLVPLSTYNASADARIRIATDSGSIWLFPNQTCTQVDVPRSFLGMPIMPSTKTALNPSLSKGADIGMPKPAMPHGRAFNETVIQAGQPLTIMGKQVFTYIAPNPVYDSDTVCGPIFATFVPKPGHDYEIFIGPHRHGEFPLASCEIYLRELKMDEGAVKSVPVEPASGDLQCNSRKTDSLH